MALASAAHKIPLEVAHTLVEIAEVARYAYNHRPGHHVADDGDPDKLPAGADGGGCASEEAERLREENAMLRARLADDLSLLRELHGAPCVSKECPPDLYNRLMAAVNNASFLAHLEKLQDESACQHAELSSGNLKEPNSLPFSALIEPEVEIGDIPDKMGNGKKGSWVLVACDKAGANLEEISGIDNENYVIINEDDIVDGIATFVARCILEDPKSKSLSPAQLQKGMSILHTALKLNITPVNSCPAVAKALDSMKARWRWSTFWEAGQIIYILTTWGITLAGLYKSRHVLKVAAKGAAVSARFVMKALRDGLFDLSSFYGKCCNCRQAMPLVLSPPFAQRGIKLSPYTLHFVVGGFEHMRRSRINRLWPTIFVEPPVAAGTAATSEAAIGVCGSARGAARDDLMDPVNFERRCRWLLFDVEKEIRTERPPIYASTVRSLLTLGSSSVELWILDFGLISSGLRVFIWYNPQLV
ncbi:hypothetical protein BAE44_0010443 [Dichanthelium oligosanthes]|uniref:Uncharacterized protein n=1 Tax=Dichanthelium oligosanthes TaxID=888268 RepID=A0A1E5VTW8_9POAL|nr:hypothetical protein BAE44_0010443 [Dichanthelium oligosanthes]